MQYCQIFLYFFLFFFKSTALTFPFRVLFVSGPFLFGLLFRLNRVKKESYVYGQDYFRYEINDIQILIGFNYKHFQLIPTAESNSTQGRAVLFTTIIGFIRTCIFSCAHQWVVFGASGPAFMVCATIPPILPIITFICCSSVTCGTISTLEKIVLIGWCTTKSCKCNKKRTDYYFFCLKVKILEFQFAEKPIWSYRKFLYSHSIRIRHYTKRRHYPEGIQNKKRHHGRHK